MVKYTRSHRLFLSNIALAAMTSLAPVSHSTQKQTSDFSKTDSQDKTQILDNPSPLADSLSLTAPVASTISAEFPLLKNAYRFCEADKYAAIVMDAVTGETLYGYQHHEPRYPASMTKMMTAFLVLDALDQGDITWTDTLRPAKSIIDYKTERRLVTLELASDETLSVKQAFDAMMVVSAADATEMLATHVTNMDSFVDRMNERATELGMTQTYFTNTTGAPDPDQKSTASDMAILLRALMQYHPDHMHILNQKSMQFREKTYKNYSALPGMDIGKTGYIGDSGFNIAVSGADSLHRHITVIYGAKSNMSRQHHVYDVQKFNNKQRPAYADSLLNHSAPLSYFPKQKYHFNPKIYQHNAMELLQPQQYQSYTPFRNLKLAQKITQPIYSP
jgi:D-alanyl-D-alanine carboxypeptidase